MSTLKQPSALFGTLTGAWLWPVGQGERPGAHWEQ